ncbi:hypothetical protein PBY51_006493 [Eleginops maclovinus]|uniref:Afadin n=1 Tax=Eleginops maclovinus TaxID=56733 RepID=A0AAN8A4M8_ELEMC|nr:hypothetical protein PBY51_006493 [Eleginops maclovinus]
MHLECVGTAHVRSGTAQQKQFRRQVGRSVSGETQTKVPAIRRNGRPEAFGVSVGGGVGFFSCGLSGKFFLFNSPGVRLSTMTGSREEERRKLADIINHWNANRLDLFEISRPTEVGDPADT